MRGSSADSETGGHRLLAPELFVTGVLLALILAGFLFRLLYIQRPYFHPDEYVSMLTAKMVADHGAPVLPSGLRYDPEIAFSYASGLSVWFLGASHFAVRWASLLFGTLSIPMAYAATRRLFSSPSAGIAAATLLAVAPEAVLWGGRARRYAMGEFLILLMLWLIWAGAIEANKGRYRVLFYIFCLVAGLTHSQTLLVIPALLLAVVTLTWRRRKAEGGRIVGKVVILEALVIALISGVLFWKATHNFVAPYATGFAAQRLEGGGTSSLAGIAASLNPFLLPAFDFSATLSKIRGLVLLEPLYKLLAIPALLTVILALLPNFDKTGRFRRTVWFLLITAAGMAFEFIFLVSEDWTGPRPRYLFVSFWPAFMMLACGTAVGLERLARYLSSLVRSPTFARWSLVPVILLPSLTALAITLPRTSYNLTHSLWDEINYHQAFQYVADHWEPDDQVMTVLTTASYWYLGKTDYYARDLDPFVFQNSKSEVVDRWTGAHWVSEAGELGDILRSGRVWFVIDASRLWHVYSLAYKQQLLTQMEPVFKTGNVYVLLPIAAPPVIPAEPEVQLEARWAGQVELAGFSLDEEALLSGQPAQLTLFWKALQPLPDYKVFVHLRDHNNQPVAQADHIPSETLVAMPTSIWRVGEVVPDVTYLTVPLNVPPGDYRLLVGMYDPETSERLPVENDQTGENAVIVTTLQRP